MAKQTIYNAGIYVRLSQEDMRAGESLSIENQKLILTKYVKEQGWNLVDTYVDDGWSGTDFDRPAVQRLLSDAQSGKVNLIICKDLSRFGRNYIEVGRYVDYIFPSYNIRFIALNDNVDTASKDTSALDMMPIVNLFNEWHAASTSKKIKAVIEANAKAGKYRTTCAPFGYTKGDDPNELVEKLEQLRSKLNCSAINLSSGFRCIQHDKNVGGSGTGQHTLGNAADICCIGQNGQPISSKLVCCAAQDIGFTGIANINDSYTYTHVDVRPGSKWYGNEIYGNGSVTTNFYQYFGISKESTAAKKEDDAMMKGIDVSVHNGTIDWQKVKDTGLDFAILRAGYGRFASQKDTKFEDNYAGAKAVGLPIGAYWYSYATTPDEAKQEAEVCISILNGKQFEYPIFFDLEEKSALDTGKENCSAMVKAFCDALENAGYYAGFYMSRSPLTTHITEEVQKRYALWVAEWGGTLNYSGSVGLWQFSSRGFVDGITGNVDLDVGYVEYPETIKANGLNGFPPPVVVEEKAPVFEQAPPTPAPTPATDDSIAVAVTIDGKTYSGKLNKA